MHDPESELLAESLPATSSLPSDPAHAATLLEESESYVKAVAEAISELASPGFPSQFEIDRLRRPLPRVPLAVPRRGRRVAGSTSRSRAPSVKRTSLVCGLLCPVCGARGTSTATVEQWEQRRTRPLPLTGTLIQQDDSIGYRSGMRVWPGAQAPLGATFDGVGTNIAVFSEVAEAVYVCVFDDDGNETSVELPERSGSVFHGYLPDVDAGTRYGFRVHGPVRSRRTGIAATRHKLLLDPYARAIDGESQWDQSVFSYTFGEEDSVDRQRQRGRRCRRASSSTRSSTGATTSDCTVPWTDTVIYETHVKGATATHPDVPRRSAARTPASPTRRSSTTSRTSASRPSSCCRCTSSCTTRTSSSVACATTGATTRSVTSRRTTTTRTAGSVASRCRTSS